MLDFVNPRTIEIRQNKYKPEPIISQSLVTNPKLFVPNYPSKINYTAQNYDFITHSKQKELNLVIKSLDVVSFSQRAEAANSRGI